MTLALSPPIRITKDDLGCFIGFKCGKENYQQALADWITQNDAVKALKNKTSIFAYATQSTPHKIVGYGSLGKSNWKLADEPGWKDFGKIKVQIIPALAVHEGFQGQGVCQFIVKHLINEALQRRDFSRLLGLFVHENNAPAIHVYEKAEFQFIRKIHVDETGVNRGMIFRL